MALSPIRLREVRSLGRSLGFDIRPPPHPSSEGSGSCPTACVNLPPSPSPPLSQLSSPPSQSSSQRLSTSTSTSASPVNINMSGTTTTTSTTAFLLDSRSVEAQPEAINAMPDPSSPRTPRHSAAAFESSPGESFISLPVRAKHRNLAMYAGMPGLTDVAPLSLRLD